MISNSPITSTLTLDQDLTTREKDCLETPPGNNEVKKESQPGYVETRDISYLISFFVIQGQRCVGLYTYLTSDPVFTLIMIRD